MAIQSLKTGKSLRRRSSSNLLAWFMVNGIFRMRQRMVLFSAATNGQ